MPFPLLKYMASIVFWTAAALSLLSLWCLPFMGLFSWILVFLSVLFNLWSLYKSDHGGFVKTRQAPRSREPLRHFSALQTLVIILLLMTQFGVTAYLLIVRKHILDQIHI